MNHYTATSFIAPVISGNPHESHGKRPRAAHHRPQGRLEGHGPGGGRHPFEAWKYWFPLGEPPLNGLRTIQDVPGTDKPLE